MNTFKLDQIRADLCQLAKMPGQSVNKIAQACGVDQASLSRFLSGKGLSGASIEKLWPLLYGVKKPDNGDRRAGRDRRKSTRRSSDS